MIGLATRPGTDVEPTCSIRSASSKRARMRSATHEELRPSRVVVHDPDRAR